MANVNPPLKNQAWTIRIGLKDFATPGRLKSSPTIASGDFKLDKDGAGLNNMATLPTVDPAASKSVMLTFSSTEMNADIVTIICSDQTDPPEWEDQLICVQTTASGGGGLDAAGVRAAVGLASANLDTQLDALPTAAENATAVTTSLLGTVHSGVAQGDGTGNDTLQLASGAVSSDDEFNGYIVAIVAGAGKGQQRQVLDTINAGDHIQVVGGDWETAPDSTSVYVLFAN